MRPKDALYLVRKPSFPLLFKHIDQIRIDNLKSIDLNQAATLRIAKHPYPIITSYELGIDLFNLIRKGCVDGQPLKLKTRDPERRHYRQVISFFLSFGVLKELRGAASESIFSILGKDEDTPPEEIVCCIDPFAYLSHLSAMEFYGFTDRIPQTVYASSPSPREWRRYAQDRMTRDLGDSYNSYLRSDFPKLIRMQLQKLRNRQINVFHREHLGAFRSIKATGVRVSTIGRTFFDMLREPDLCGGIRHVLSVYEEHAREHVRLIVDDIDSHGNAIDKVRAGYVLQEVLGIDDPTIENWTQFAQRGGSRKLYAKNEYSSTYSQKWCLSVNVD